MTLPQREAEYFPELNLPLLKSLIENRTVRRFKGLPLEKITLYRYSGQYQAALQPTTQYVIVFDLEASWQELTEDQLEKCRDLDADTGWMGTVPDENTLHLWGLDGAFRGVYKLLHENYFKEWQLFLRLYPCEDQVPDRPGFYTNQSADLLSPGFNGKTAKGIMLYEPSIILYEGFFPNLRLNILEEYSKNWVKRYSEAPISRIRLHKYVFSLECAVENDLEEKYQPPPYKYAIVFEVAAENKIHDLNEKELFEYDLKKMSGERPLESYERLLDATDPNSTEPYEKRYKELIDEAFKNVYVFPVENMDNRRKDWAFYVKFKNTELNANAAKPVFTLFINQTIPELDKKSPLEKTVDIQDTKVELENVVKDGRIADAPSLEGFSHSPDYRSVTIKGQTFVLTTNQAAIVQCLHEAYDNGNPELSQAYVFERIGSSALNPRLNDTFKGKSEAKKALIATGKGKGTIRLNI